MVTEIETTKKIIEIIALRFSHKKQIAASLAQLLNINIKTIRKKLKGESPFTFDEIITLTREYDLDLNKIIKAPLPYHPLKLFSPDWGNPEEAQKDAAMFLNTYRSGASGGNSEVMIATNNFPKFVLSQCKHLNKIDWYAHRYYNEIDFKITPGEFKTIQLDNTFNIEMMNTYGTYEKFSCILNIHMMSNTAQLLTYFYNISLIDKEDIRNLMEDCENIIDWLENICNRGTLENGKPAEILYSELGLPMDFNIIYSNRFKWASIQHHFDHVVLIDDPTVVDVAKGWFIICKKTSNNISGIAEISRNYFFNKQRIDLREKLSKITG